MLPSIIEGLAGSWELGKIYTGSWEMPQFKMISGGRNPLTVIAKTEAKIVSERLTIMAENFTDNRDSFTTIKNKIYWIEMNQSQLPGN